MVEFALVLPMLLVLLLGVADFGRVFASGIILEASARNSSEVAALERLRTRPPAVADPTYYADIHRLAVNAACEESRELPTFDGSDACPSGAHDENGNPSWFAGVCVHDGADPSCGAAPTGYSTAPGECSLMAAPWSNTYEAAASYYVEVRLCYKFETLFNLNLSLPLGWGLNLGDVWLQRTRSFVVDCPPGADPADLTTNCPNP